MIIQNYFFNRLKSGSVQLNYKIALLCVAVTISACVTQRKTDEAHGTKLFFQNLNAKYNGFFNATVLMDEAQDKLRAQHVDNFAKVLDVYPELAVENPKSVSAELDKAIEKVAVVATFHRASDWTDDCYLMLGKAQYFKHNFEDAQETFEYMSEVYDPLAKRRPITAADRKANAAEAAIAKKKTLKEKEIARYEVAKEKEKTLKEKTKERAAIAKEKKRALDLKRKERERETKARAEARKRGIKLPPRAKPDETVKSASTNKNLVVTGNNATPVYKTDVLRERKQSVDTKAGGPKSYFLKHRPCFQESQVWLARTYTERQDYSDADFILAKLEKSPKTFKDIRAMAAIARADLFLKQKNSDGAIAALEAAVELKHKPRTKARLYFILGQLLNARAETEKANIAFGKVLNHNPVYEMEFNARLNRALTSAQGESAASKLLRDMSTDYKNREYNDQVYFALGQLALKNNKRDEAIDYFRKSLTAKGKNPQIKTDAYQALARYEYDSENFAVAKLYYDSSLIAMGKNDERMNETTRLSKNLTDIARNYNIVKLQDSILRIAALSDADKRDWAKAQAKKQRLEQEAIATTKSNAERAARVSKGVEEQTGIVKSSFFGYDADLVKKGRKEFEKKWGTDRKLEDNWRRSNKRTNLADTRSPFDTSSAAQLSEADYKSFLKDIPKTPEEIAAANQKLDEALFQLGTLYHDKLQRDKISVATLEKHLVRFPATNHKVEDYYYLYTDLAALGNSELSKKYFDLILKEFPESNYAKTLTQGAPEIKPTERTVEKYYNETYALFQKKDFAATKEKINASNQILGVNNYYKAKFDLLNALVDGRLQGKDAYIAGLKNVIALHPNTEEDKRAREILRIIESGVPIAENPADTKKDTTISEDLSLKFKADNAKLHYVIVVLPKDADLEKVKISVSDYNTRFHRLDDLKISSVYLSTESEIPVIVVRKFKDKVTALAYTTNAETPTAEFAPGIKRDIFAVTQDNYREILRQKSVDAYKKFYQLNY